MVTGNAGVPIVKVSGRTNASGTTRVSSWETSQSVERLRGTHHSPVICPALHATAPTAAQPTRSARARRATVAKTDGGIAAAPSAATWVTPTRAQRAAHQPETDPPPGAPNTTSVSQKKTVNAVRWPTSHGQRRRSGTSAANAASSTRRRLPPRSTVAVITAIAKGITTPAWARSAPTSGENR